MSGWEFLRNELGRRCPKAAAAQKSGVRSQEAGARRQEAGGRRQEAEDRRQEAVTGK